MGLFGDIGGLLAKILGGQPPQMPADPGAGPVGTQLPGGSTALPQSAPAAAPSGGGGIMSSLGGLLSNPTVMELLPTMLGAAGGALTSPRMAGTRGAVGRGLLGGAQGLVEGQQAALNQQKIQAEAQKFPAELAETQARTGLIQKQTEQLQNTLDNQKVFIPAFNSYLDTHVKDPLVKSQLQMLARTDAKGALTQASLEATKGTNINLIAKMKGIDPAQLQGLDAKQAADLAVKVMTGDKYDVKAIPTADGVVLASINKANPSDITYTNTGLHQVPTGGISLTPIVSPVTGEYAVFDRKTGTFSPAGPGAPKGEIKGSVTETQAAAHVMDYWTKAHAANEATALANAKASFPGFTPAPLPNPNLPDNPTDFLNSPEGRNLHDSYMGKGESAAPAAPKADLKGAPDWHSVPRATGPAVVKGVPRNLRNGFVKQGKHYVVKEDKGEYYAYPANG